MAGTYFLAILYLLLLLANTLRVLNDDYLCTNSCLIITEKVRFTGNGNMPGQIDIYRLIYMKPKGLSKTVLNSKVVLFLRFNSIVNRPRD